MRAFSFIWEGSERDRLNKSESKYEIEWAVDFNILEEIPSGPGEVSVGSR